MAPLPTPECFLCPVTLFFDLLTPKWMDSQDLWWNIYVSSLVIQAVAVFEIDRQTDRQTQTPLKTLAAVGVCNEQPKERFN